MDRSKLSHDILNLLERLRIMHGLLKEQNFEAIPKDEIKQDLEEAISELKEKFNQLAQ